MKRFKTIAIIGMALVFLTLGGAMAGEHPGDHPTGSGKAMDHPSMEHRTDKMEHPGDHPGSHGKAMGHPSQGHAHPAGNHIRTATVDGYRLTYEMIDMREKINAMKAAGHTHEMNMTHHLMLFVRAPDGTPVTSAKVGFLVKAPDGTKQKLMSMAMGGGYGADINLGSPGPYTIKSKSVVGDKKIMDSFEQMIQ